jgi:hypothetical protein
MRLSAAWRFSAAVSRFLIVCSRRFCKAPKELRWCETFWRALFTVSMAVAAPHKDLPFGGEFIIFITVLRCGV